MAIQDVPAELEAILGIVNRINVSRVKPDALLETRDEAAKRLAGVIRQLRGEPGRKTTHVWRA